MHLTRFTDYGLRTLIYLALQPDRLGQIRDIAAAYHVSENHMVKVIHRLGQADFIETIRGRNGGVRLAHAPEQIIIGDVVRKMEADFTFVECQGNGECAIHGACRLESILDEAAAALFSVLDRYSLRDVVNPRNRALADKLKTMLAISAG